eukprot:1120508-Pleurochrysis_carterae.AAC.6
MPERLIPMMRACGMPLQVQTTASKRRGASSAQAEAEPEKPHRHCRRSAISATQCIIAAQKVTSIVHVVNVPARTSIFTSIPRKACTMMSAQPSSISTVVQCIGIFLKDWSQNKDISHDLSASRMLTIILSCAE